MNTLPPSTPDCIRRLSDEERKRLLAKVPSWAVNEDIVCPTRLAWEQCSGEAAARHKADVVTRLLPPVKRGRMVDLTGGLGVDFSFLAPLFREAVYVEQQAVLCETAHHNFPLLGLTHAEVVCGTAEDFLNRMPPADFIFLDPARRDKAGRKTVLIQDCTPDVEALLPRLLEKAPLVMVKLSPMLDIRHAVKSLQGHVHEVEVVETAGECKELLLVLRADGTVDEPKTTVVRGCPVLSFFTSEERNAAVSFCEHPAPGDYLFEPCAALLKAGAFRLVAERFGLKKVAADSHLYIGMESLPSFPGRSFRIQEVTGFDKAALRRLRQTTERANLTLRNFPGTTEALRKKLKLKDGGDTYLFATTLQDGKHVLLVTQKA